MEHSWSERHAGKLALLCGAIAGIAGWMAYQVAAFETMESSQKGYGVVLYVSVGLVVLIFAIAHFRTYFRVARELAERGRWPSTAVMSKRTVPSEYRNCARCRADYKCREHCGECGADYECTAHLKERIGDALVTYSKETDTYLLPKGRKYVSHAVLEDHDELRFVMRPMRESEAPETYEVMDLDPSSDDDEPTYFVRIRERA